MVRQGPIDEDIDPRVEEEITRSQLVEQLEDVQEDKGEPTRILKIGSTLPPVLKEELGNFLKKNMDVFAWTHANREGINAELMCYCLNVYPSYLQKHQKRSPMNPQRYEALEEEVDKLIKIDFIKEAHYPDGSQTLFW